MKREAMADAVDRAVTYAKSQRWCGHCNALQPLEGGSFRQDRRGRKRWKCASCTEVGRKFRKEKQK